MINKPTIIITSLGRTGTKFFANLFNIIIDDCIALHEPERLTGLNPKYFKEIFFVIKNFGIYNPTIKKIMGKWGITSISDKRIREEISKKEAIKLLTKERHKFIESFPQSIYIEASYHYYGLIDIIPEVFRYQKVVYIIRDGRDWVRSHMNRTGWYSLKNSRTLFKNILSPTEGEYKIRWKTMKPFDKLCWMWATVNEYVLDSLKNNPQAKIFYFEDIFQSNNKYENLQKLIDFIADFNEFKISYKKELLKNSLEKKINQSKKYNFPSWQNWTPEQKNQFKKICGKTMKKFGYQ